MDWLDSVADAALAEVMMLADVPVVKRTARFNFLTRMPFHIPTSPLNSGCLEPKEARFHAF